MEVIISEVKVFVMKIMLSKNRVMLLGLSLVLLFGAAACDSDDGALKVSSPWVTEEVLSQLQELRKSNKELVETVSALNDSVKNLEAKVSGLASGRPAAPSAPKSLAFNNTNAMGSKKARVAIIEYTDYQCPFCSRHSKQVLPEIKKKLVETNKVAYVVEDFPLGFHGAAKKAAVAANCAGKQGKYWPMHDALFASPNRLGEELYQEIATAEKLNMKKFSACLNDPDNEKAIDRSIAAGSEIGVTGTPKFFIGQIEGDTIINVTSISGAQSYGVFEAAVEKHLK
jgi:protein-disulfide isomerase